ncbi:MAG: hypothetical protein OXJ37_12815 [Bryobacterales bacterium]|nr:hypothetical protein [Bryobacterales bacterium]
MTVTDRDQSHASVCPPYRFAQALEVLGLRFIGNHYQPDIGGFGRGVDQRREAEILGLANIEYRVPPRGIAAQLQSEAGLAYSGKSPDVKVQRALGVVRGVEVELSPCSG